MIRVGSSSVHENIKRSREISYISFATNFLLNVYWGSTFNMRRQEYFKLLEQIAKANKSKE
jgi:hypothetical protein